MSSQRFVVRVAAAGPDRMWVPIPFDPDEIWGAKLRHHVAGTINGVAIRTVIESVAAGHGLTLGPKAPSRMGLTPGDEVTVEIAPEGPQRDDLADDVAQALTASPAAAAFFDSLAQFYRRGYLRWIDATKRRPDERAARIAEMVRLLESGIKQRS
jgi:hypothetical protein